MPSSKEWSACFSRLETIIKRPLITAEKANLQGYIELLLKWNRSYNLIGPSTVATVLERHVIDSAPLLPLISSGKKVADIGSGAGFPGLILAILSQPHTQINLVESSGKKVRFLQHAINHLDLQDRCRVFQERAEQHVLQFSGNYSYVVSRAVGTLSLLAKLSHGMLQPGGCCLALKGERSDAEVAEFLSGSFRSFFENPEIIDIELITGATVISLKKVSRET
ncbi:MAG: 16S rRNA (guanine(527)-N(7))-methyltransferase RsmG [Magnetococcales bacterium]|nr:16S rRNA (guanine(527)-N(7))-methyltransferase RsmG [Magnetococcales bacterium]